MKVLVIDNYDSFVYNLVQYIEELGGETLVHRNDNISLKQAMELKPNRIVISPGPGTPAETRYFGVCSSILQHMGCRVPTLGVCLGHQGIIHTFGGKIVSARRLMHGKTSLIKHDGKGVFKGVKNPFTATRYHSLVGDRSSVSSCLKITAESLDDGEIMGVRHVAYPIEGVQFHPESILCEEGKLIVQNFLEGCDET
ncbi:MAG: aminodeoxychorismate/anthranilate synthase component II [Candidatus Bathyarchaeota archaeon]|nr:MAG: aminodeoxychorismate/anthranilate synthase component II [Candidatus Bathyarchaeota archaeon]